LSHDVGLKKLNLLGGRFADALIASDARLTTAS